MAKKAATPRKAAKAAKTPRTSKGKATRKPAKRAARAAKADGAGETDAVGLVSLHAPEETVAVLTTDGTQRLEADDIPLVTLATEDELEDPIVEAAPKVRRSRRRSQEAEAPTAEPFSGPWSLPEQFFAVALHEGWDDRMERPKAGSQGAALVASMLFELALRGRARIHLDRYQLVGEPTDDAALEAFAAQVQEHAHLRAEVALERLARRSGILLDPWRARLQERGFVHAEQWRFLGFLRRSRTTVVDPEAKSKLENRLQRTLVGGTPDVRTILLLGLIDAAGLLHEIIPAGALAFNRKRIHALLTGKDTLGYRVDPGIHDLQGAFVVETLQGVRRIQGVA